MYRLLHIFFQNVSQLYPIHEWEYDNQTRIHHYSLQVIFTHSPFFLMELYGFDGKKKWSSRNIKDLSRIFLVISAMPMGNLKPPFQSSSLFDLCGLPLYDQSTNHCFADATHRTCCLLGGKARKYADASGNPIGKASEKAFLQKYGFTPTESTLTPWCTCMGSGVCTYYARRFADGTHPKFLNPVSGNVLVNQQDEQRFAAVEHETPGVMPLFRNNMK